MQAWLPFWAIFVMYYFFGSKTGCTFFNWFQKKLKVSKIVEFKPANRKTALSTMMELTMLLWTFYLVLLFAYDDQFFGDRHVFTYFVAFGSLFWSLYLFFKLLKIRKLDYAIRYAIPTVIIFWNFVEILGRWNFFKEIWIEPQEYWLEMTLIFGVFVLLLIISFFGKRKTKQIWQDVEAVFRSSGPVSISFWAGKQELKERDVYLIFLPLKFLAVWWIVKISTWSFVTIL